MSSTFLYVCSSFFSGVLFFNFDNLLLWIIPFSLILIGVFQDIFLVFKNNKAEIVSDIEKPNYSYSDHSNSSSSKTMKKLFFEMQDRDLGNSISLNTFKKPYKEDTKPSITKAKILAKKTNFDDLQTTKIGIAYEHEVFSYLEAKYFNTHVITNHSGTDIDKYAKVDLSAENDTELILIQCKHASKNFYIGMKKSCGYDLDGFVQNKKRYFSEAILKDKKIIYQFHIKIGKNILKRDKTIIKNDNEKAIFFKEFEDELQHEVEYEDISVSIKVNHEF